MILLNFCHVILFFATKYRVSKTVLQLTYTDQIHKYAQETQPKTVSLRGVQAFPKEDLTLVILHLLTILHLYNDGPLNQLPNYFLTKSAKE